MSGSTVRISRTRRTHGRPLQYIHLDVQYMCMMQCKIPSGTFPIHHKGGQLASRAASRAALSRRHAQPERRRSNNGCQPSFILSLHCFPHAWHLSDSRMRQGRGRSTTKQGIRRNRDQGSGKETRQGGEIRLCSIGMQAGQRDV